MKHLMLVILLLATMSTNAESFKYMYGGQEGHAPSTFIRLNEEPVHLNFLEDIEAIQVVYGDENVLFYVMAATKEDDETIVAAMKKDGTKAIFSIRDKVTIFQIDDYIYVITNIPKEYW